MWWFLAWMSTTEGEGRNKDQFSQRKILARAGGAQLSWVLVGESWCEDGVVATTRGATTRLVERGEKREKKKRGEMEERERKRKKKKFSRCNLNYIVHWDFHKIFGFDSRVV